MGLTNASEQRHTMKNVCVDGKERELESKRTSWEGME